MKTAYNGRQNEIALTEMALESKERIIGIAQETMKGLFSGFTEDQTHTFVEMLTQLSSPSIPKTV